MMLRYLLLASFLLFVGCAKQESRREVVVYVSEDRVFSEPVLKAFERQSGIRVLAVYDTEESKGTGLMQRLIAEREHPLADVYWANEPLRAAALKSKGVLEPYKSPSSSDIEAIYKDPQDYWCGFSARLRLFIVNKGAKLKPQSILSYLDDNLSAKGVIANPLFGSTLTHLAALSQLKGREWVIRFLAGLKAKNIAISASNGESADLVAKGRYDFALVDSDDALSRIAKGALVEILYPDQKGEDALGVFLIPNSVMLIKGAAHKQEAKALIDFLLSPQSEAMLAKAACAQIPLHKGVAPPKGLKPLNELKVMQVDYSKAADALLGLIPMLDRWSKE